MPELREAVAAILRALKDMHRYNPVQDAANDIAEAERIMGELDPAAAAGTAPAQTAAAAPKGRKLKAVRKK